MTRANHPRHPDHCSEWQVSAVSGSYPYDYWIEDVREGPLINPVQLDRRHRGQRPHVHHNPLEPFQAEGKIRYNPKVPKRRPREMPEERWRDVFAGLRSNRDRALLSMDISWALLHCAKLGQARVLIPVGQIAKVSSPKAAATPSVVGSSTPSS